MNVKTLWVFSSLVYVKKNRTTQLLKIGECISLAVESGENIFARSRKQVVQNNYKVTT